METEKSLKRSKLISLKLIHIYEIYAINARAYDYQIYEANPEKQQEIKNKMLLTDLFAIAQSMT